MTDAGASQLAEVCLFDLVVWCYRGIISSWNYCPVLCVVGLGLGLM